LTLTDAGVVLLVLLLLLLLVVVVVEGVDPVDLPVKFPDEEEFVFMMELDIILVVPIMNNSQSLDSFWM